MSDTQMANLNDIKMLVIDVDGVMTDGTIILDSNGNESKRFSILDGHGMPEIGVVEADPIRVVEHVGAAQRFRQPLRFVKVEGPHVDPLAEGVLAIGRTGQRSDPVPGLQQTLGDIPARIAERPRHNMQLGIRHQCPSHHSTYSASGLLSGVSSWSQMTGPYIFSRISWPSYGSVARRAAAGPILTT
jgi:hypothetical protein